MKAGFAIAALALGVALGGGAVAAWTAFGPGSDADTIDAALKIDAKGKPADTISTAALARILLRRVAGTYVGDNRDEWSKRQGVELYAEPKAYGDFLCRVDITYLPPKVVRGFSTTPKERWQDDISVRTMYAVWKKPRGVTLTNAKRDDDSERDDACRRFRRFDRMIYADDPLAAQRALSVLDQAIDAAKSGNATFSADCIDARHTPPTKCDAWVLLKGVKLGDVSQIDPVGMRDEPEMQNEHTDVVHMRSTVFKCGRTEAVTIDVTSVRTAGGDDKPKYIKVLRSTIC